MPEWYDVVDVLDIGAFGYLFYILRDRLHGGTITEKLKELKDVATTTSQSCTSTSQRLKDVKVNGENVAKTLTDIRERLAVIETQLSHPGRLQTGQPHPPGNASTG